MKKINTSDEQAWLTARLNDITSTEVSALFGCNPYMTQFELWHRKKAQKIVTIQRNDRMVWGIRLEDAIARGIAEDNNIQIRRINQYWSDGTRRIGSSFDYGIDDTGSGTGLLEIKNVDAWAAQEGWTIITNDIIEAPPHIEFQMQHQLLVSGRKFAYIGALIGGNRVILLKREPNEKVHDAILSKVGDFWKSIESDCEPNPVLERDADMIIELCGNATEGKAIAGSPAIDEIAQRYIEASEVIKEAEQDKKIAKAELLLAIGDAAKVVGSTYSISAGEIGESVVESHVRPAYRGFRVTAKKGAKPKE